MFLTRLISGVVLLAVMAGLIRVGGPLLWAVLMAVSLIGQYELYRAVKVTERNRIFSPLALSGYLGTILYYCVLLLENAGILRGGGYGTAVICVCLAAVMSVYVFGWPAYHADQAMAALFGVVYVSVMISFIYQVRVMEGGMWLTILIFICSWGCDTFAYCFGMLFGKHKMAPKLSPKKSIEGAVGGVAGAAALGALFGWLMSLTDYLSVAGHAPAGEFALICALGALISMVGDLAASAIKRNHDIKDYGRLIPGHGGILDRFDSVIFTSPMIWLLCRLIL